MRLPWGHCSTSSVPQYLPYSPQWLSWWRPRLGTRLGRAGSATCLVVKRGAVELLEVSQAQAPISSNPPDRLCQKEPWSHHRPWRSPGPQAFPRTVLCATSSLSSGGSSTRGRWAYQTFPRHHDMDCHRPTRKELHHVLHGTCWATKMHALLPNSI